MPRPSVGVYNTSRVEDVHAAHGEAKRALGVAIAKMNPTIHPMFIHAEENASTSRRVELACQARGVDAALMKVHCFFGRSYDRDDSVSSQVKSSIFMYLYRFPFIQIICCLVCDKTFKQKNWAKTAARHPVTIAHVRKVAYLLRVEVESLMSPLRCPVSSCSRV
jgi:hypothetical protein